MTYKNFHGIYLKSDEHIVHEARLSMASLIVTWLSIPGVFLIFFMLTYVPHFIRNALFNTVKNAAMDELGIPTKETTEHVFDAISGAFLVTLCIPIILLVLAWLGWCLFMTRRHFRSSLAITDFRVIGRSNDEELDSPLGEVVNVFLEQSLWGRLFNYGNLTVYTKKSSLVFYDIGEPQNIRYLLMKNIEKP